MKKKVSSDQGLNWKTWISGKGSLNDKPILNVSEPVMIDYASPPTIVVMDFQIRMMEIGELSRFDRNLSGHLAPTETRELPVRFALLDPYLDLRELSKDYGTLGKHFKIAQWLREKMPSYYHVRPATLRELLAIFAFVEPFELLADGAIAAPGTILMNNGSKHIPVAMYLGLLSIGSQALISPQWNLSAGRGKVPNRYLGIVIE